MKKFTWYGLVRWFGTKVPDNIIHKPTKENSPLVIYIEITCHSQSVSDFFHAWKAKIDSFNLGYSL